ncbi:hypothetical protein Glove_109g10 [Diversispora epigaea]|uniref:Uncharacterized protein n=1 Tax=Diversispora epigaea TaxID=1348612 RepID=A0A397JBN6_9GLOM|nr:hypothetical protein Glove_109g10 [Diversispora epigaea]
MPHYHLPKLLGMIVATAENHKSISTNLISTVGICARSGSSVLRSVEADLYFTEGFHIMTYSLHWLKISVILCEHTNTERGYLSEILKPFLENEINKNNSNNNNDDDNIISIQRYSHSSHSFLPVAMLMVKE